MKLNEFKQALENDAIKRADAQEQTIRKLHMLITEQRTMIEALKAFDGAQVSRIAQLEHDFLECRRFGPLCLMCGSRRVCKVTRNLYAKKNEGSKR